MPERTVRPRRTAVRRAAALTALALAASLSSVFPAGAAEAATAAPLAPAATRPADRPQAEDPRGGEESVRKRLRLPRPSGPYRVGRDTLHLTDRSRPDPWRPETGPRQLMVSVYYPALRGTGAPDAPYMTKEEAGALLEGLDLKTAGDPENPAGPEDRKAAGAPEGTVPVETVASVRTNARTGARPAPGRHPLVLLSPGFTLQRSTLSVVAEELAGRGYVVALTDHAYESYGTSFPGRFTTCAACDAVESAPDEEASRKLLAEVARGRAADLSFVVDELTSARPAWRHGRMIDSRRVGAAGHSIGGNAAAQLMVRDARVRAGVNLDGTFFTPVPQQGLGGRPLMMVGTTAGHAPGGVDVSWDEAWRRLDGWKRWLTVRDSGHFSFCDIPVLAGQLGMSDPEVPLPGDRSGEITRAYTGAFFDRQLRGLPQPLLDGPTPGNPEVVFNRP